MATVDANEVAADTSVVHETPADKPHARDQRQLDKPEQDEPEQDRPEQEEPQAPEEDTGPSLFDKGDVPDTKVDDFFAYLERSKGAAAEQEQEKQEDRVAQPAEPVVEPDRSPGIPGLGEGTGEPRPITSQPKPAQHKPAQARPAQPQVSRPQPIQRREPAVAKPEVQAPKQPVEQAVSQSVQPQQDLDVQEKWDRVPHHLQALFGEPKSEVAQNSYKTFKESRDDLIQRLLDPVISLEEAARVLNVCPTTVRRYTNRGVLRHHRTAGNQRRFKLSDVLAFLESSGRTAKKTRTDSAQGAPESA